jgi:hypothetical protein
LRARLEEARKRLDGADFPEIEPIGPEALAAHVEGWGISIPEGSSVFFNHDSSQLVARTYPEKLERLATVINGLNGESATGNQIYLTSKIANMPEGQIVEDRVMKEPEFQEVVNGWNQTREVDILSAPSLVTRVAQPGKIQVGREVVFPAKLSPDGEIMEFGTDLAGTVIEFLPKQTGEIVHLTGSIDLSEIDEDKARVNQDDVDRADVEKVVGSPVKHFVKEFDITLHDGQSALIHCDSPDPDREVALSITMQRINPAGKNLQ